MILPSTEKTQNLQPRRSIQQYYPWIPRKPKHLSKDHKYALKREEGIGSYVVWWRYLTLIYWNDSPWRQDSVYGSKDDNITHESNPTPNPLTSRPRIIDQTPTVNVWMSPPTVNTTAPPHKVHFRPTISPILPAATDVTWRNRRVKKKLIICKHKRRHTEGANL